jgi:hypothetical protein
LAFVVLGLVGCRTSIVEDSEKDPECREANLADRDAAELFGEPGISRFELTLEGVTFAQLQKRAREEEYVRVSACHDGQLIGNVGMRFKGQIGTLERCFEEGVLICSKLSLRLKFDEYEAHQRFFGLKRLNLHSMRSDDSHLRERLAYDLYRAAGVEAPRSAWTELVVDGVSQGLFAMVEQVDGRFTSSRWPEDGDGDLYKEAWPVSREPEFYREHLETDAERAQPELLGAIAAEYLDAPPSARLELLRRRTDVEHLLRLLAVDDAIHNWDGITTFYAERGENHNFFLYLRDQHAGSSQASFRIIPWDMDNTFRFETWLSSAPHWRQRFSDCPRVVLGTQVAGCDPIFAALAEDEAGYRRAVRALLEGAFRPGEIEASLEQHAARLRGPVERDRLGPSLIEWERDVQRLRDDLPRLRERLARLADGPPIEPVALSPAGVNDFSNIDALEARLGLLVVSGQGASAHAELSPAGGPLTGIRLAFRWSADAVAFAYYGIAFDAPDVDLRGKTGFRFKARAQDVPFASLILNPRNAPIEAPRWSWVLPSSEEARTIELRFDRAEIAGGGDAAALERVLEHVEGIGVNVAGRGADANGYIELDDFEVF